MYETPQTFASKAAIIEVLKRASGAQLTRDQVLEAASRELDISPTEVARALDELQLEDHVASVVIDGQERIQFAPASL
jgi:Fe2+ or Zn2+ uptake regulation protein